LITDLANLGPSLRTTAGLEKSSTGKRQSNSQTGNPEAASSFGAILQQATAYAPKDRVRTNNVAKPGPAPVNENAAPKVEAPKTAKVSPNTSEPRTAPKQENDWDEAGSVQRKKQETVGDTTEASLGEREAVMLQFMDSMESEFGIPPVNMVEAMTQLPTEAQLATPEETAAQVIAQLNIPEDRKPEALALYLAMLAQLQMPALSRPIDPNLALAAATGGGAGLAMLGKQEKQVALHSSLDNMNNKFFMNGQPPMKESSVATDRLMNGESLTADKPAVPLTESAEINRESSSLLKPEMSTKELAEQLQQMQALDPKGPEAELMLQKLAALGMAAKALDYGLKSDPQNADTLAIERNLQQNGFFPNNSNFEGMTAFSAAGIQGLSKSGAETFGEGSSEKGNDGSSSNADSLMVNTANQPMTEAKAMKVDFAAALGGAALAAGKTGEADVSQASIQQIMKQAQYMIKKGGGESKIQMSPEGLGQLHMKVVVNEGKVNLEMTAETKEAKKALEGSLNDLRSSLGQHKLTVDQVKVDVGNQLASDNREGNKDSQQQQQKQMDMNRDQRNQTREFWSEFQNQGQSRGTFQESPGIRAYSGARRPDPLTPNNSPSVGEKRYVGSGKGRGLDLVG